MSYQDIYKVQDVFTPTKPARATFVERESINDRLVNALRTPGKQLVVYGHSGSGKTTLLINKLHQIYEHHITTRCIRGVTFEHLLFDAFDQLNIHYEVEKVSSTNKEVSPSLKAEYIGIKAEIGAKLNKSEQTKYQRILSPQLTPQALARLLGGINCCWVIEDFHKIDSGEKIKLAQIMKVFVDMADNYDDLKIIVTGTVDTARQVVENDPELRNRVAEIHVPLMTDAELIQIPTKGEEFLNFTIPTEIKESIVKYSNGLASECHQLCLNICFAAGISETLEKHQSIDNWSLKEAIHIYLENTSDTLKAAFDKACKQSGRSKFKNEELILKTLLEYSQEGATKDQLSTSIRATYPDYPSRNLSRYLTELQKDIRGTLIRFDSASGRYSFSEPFFRTYAFTFFEEANSTFAQETKFLEASQEQHPPQVSLTTNPAYQGVYDGVETNFTGQEWSNKKEQIYASDHLFEIRQGLFRRIKNFFENPRNLSVYLKELSLKLGEMPFIYKDFEGDVLNNFTEVTFTTLDLESLREKNSYTPNISGSERLRSVRKILIFGRAGIGKTTFMRKSVLDIIKNRSNANFIYEDENPIPIYVPLKLVDNTGRYPILRYILKNNPLLFGNSGIETLHKLAEQNRLFLFLDGYDEIQFSAYNSIRSPIQEELDLLMSESTDNDYWPFTNFRIWLTTRMEFFAQHRICTGVKEHPRTSSVFALELTGLNENRTLLVKRIFDRYRKANSSLSQILREEEFLSRIDSSSNELSSISYNPLFLGISCYVYTKTIMEGGNIADSISDLILECIGLLLNDLDTYKVRGMSAVDAELTLRRKSSYIEEKKAFLSYLAKRLLIESKSVFTFNYLKDSAMQYFERIYQSVNQGPVFDEQQLEQSIILPLINSGIFVIVDRNDNETQYSFPHIVFQEVLASQNYE